jgi:hypothetical protein
MLLRVHAAVVNFAQLPGFVEVGQRELSTFIRICRKLSGAAVPAIGLRHGPNGLGFELVPKRDQPLLYFGVTGRKSKPAAPLHLIAESFDLGHPASIFSVDGIASIAGYSGLPSNFPTLRSRSPRQCWGQKIPAWKVLGSDAGLRKLGSVRLGAMPSGG